MRDQAKGMTNNNQYSNYNVPGFVTINKFGYYELTIGIYL